MSNARNLARVVADASGVIAPTNLANVAPADGSITTVKLAANAVTDAKIAAVSASKLTGQVADANAPSGSVIQVVTYTTSASGGFATTSTGFVTWATAPQATITLSNPANKVLIIARIGMQHDGEGQISNTIYRAISGGSTVDLVPNTYGMSFHGVAAGGGLWKDTNVSWSDSPNTTSPVTYTWYSRSENGVGVAPEHFGCTTSMILLEIAA